MPRTVLITTRSFGTGTADPEQALSATGLEPIRSDRSHDLARLRDHLPEAVARIAGTAPVTDEHPACAIDRLGMAAVEEVLRVVQRGQPPLHPVVPPTCPEMAS